MKRLKVVTLIGTRPEIIKLSLTMKELDKHCTHVIVHTGQNFDYELNQIFFDDLELRKPDYFLEAAGTTPAETISKIIASFDQVLEKEKPDAVLVYGDTNSCLGVICAKRRKIPIFHLEAGNRCFDLRVPEEINRKIVDHLSDINFVHSEHARRYLLNEGLSPDRIMWSGSPMPEVIRTYKHKIEKSTVLSTLNLVPKEYFVVSAHREENVDNPQKLTELIEAIYSIANTYSKKVVFSVHPRTQKKINDLQIDTNKMKDRILFSKPLSFTDYVALQMSSFCTISDSGTLTEEASILKFPSIMLRNAHERPEGMDEAVTLLTPIKAESLLRNVALCLATKPSGAPVDYRAEDVSSKVVKVIFSYIDFINEYTWRK